jgi:Holliday junction resolvasome RuvABC DNA-binding subunit
MPNKSQKGKQMKKQTQKTIELGSISYDNSTPAQKNKFSTLEKLGFKKMPSDDGFVMYELTPSRLNQQKKTA